MKAGQMERAMGQLTVRKVDDELIRRLKIRAAEHGRSAEAEHREILKQALLPDVSWEAWLREIRQLSEEIGPVSGDSTDLIREMRDQR
jgi:plasmid stability protein